MSLLFQRVGGLLSHMPAKYSVLQIAANSAIQMTLLTETNEVHNYRFDIDSRYESPREALFAGINLGLLLAVKNQQQKHINIEITDPFVVSMLTRNAPPADDMCAYYMKHIRLSTIATHWTGIREYGYNMNID